MTIKRIVGFLRNKIRSQKYPHPFTLKSWRLYAIYHMKSRPGVNNVL